MAEQNIQVSIEFSPQPLLYNLPLTRLISPPLLCQQLWKTRKLIKQLDSARGAGTSMISLIIPPKASILQARVVQLLC
jgi:hypothetical protein